jgi:hypothetical protein
VSSMDSPIESSSVKKGKKKHHWYPLVTHAHWHKGCTALEVIVNQTGFLYFQAQYLNYPNLLLFSKSFVENGELN